MGQPGVRDPRPAEGQPFQPLDGLQVGQNAVSGRDKPEVYPEQTPVRADFNPPSKPFDGSDCPLLLIRGGVSGMRIATPITYKLWRSEQEFRLSYPWAGRPRASPFHHGNRRKRA